MLTVVLSLLGLAVAGLALLGMVFVGGMRAKWPPVSHRVRRMNRRFMNPSQMATAGQPGAFAGVLHHVGRTSGRRYETPLGIETYGDGFVIAMVYGRQSDWVRNVLVAGSARIDLEGEHHDVDRPEIVPTTDVGDVFSASDRAYQRVLAVDECLLLRRAQPLDGDQADVA